jgi:hypothetical protein
LSDGTGVKQLGHFLHERCGLTDLIGVALTAAILAWVLLAIDAAASRGSLLNLLR